MDHSAAEAFPALYRAILDGVAELEQAGRREEAFAIRRDATAAYSGAWGAGGQHRLETLISRVDRVLASASKQPSAPGASAPAAHAADRAQDRAPERPAVAGFHKLPEPR